MSSFLLTGPSMTAPAFPHQTALEGLGSQLGLLRPNFCPVHSGASSVTALWIWGGGPLFHTWEGRKVRGLRHLDLILLPPTVWLSLAHSRHLAYVFVCLLLFSFFLFLSASSAACRSSRARGQIKQSCSCRPTPQPQQRGIQPHSSRAMLDP